MPASLNANGDTVFGRSVDCQLSDENDAFMSMTK